ncbi:Tn3 family transposase [Legionella sp. PATHC035]|uniref:Tn3 family transposase n=1 Tax=Legionella sp. PATHC035 TaxID=2992040 RepID=UPI0022441E74|nr:Tn3 family transposase [Legionella sp. PATHC035]MCW8407472.1 Tn3 family transposase [Legionella sp. PATHC035]
MCFVGCQRLIQNAIVLWNELYLSQKLALLEDEESRKALLTVIRNGSTLIWHYVNLHGEYDFTQDIEDQDILFDMNKILALKVRLAISLPVWAGYAVKPYLLLCYLKEK